MRVVQAGILALLILSVTVWWANLQPTITPADVWLEADLQPASPDLVEVSPEYGWELVVTVNSANAKPLFDLRQRSYSNIIYPFSPGRGIGAWDFMLGWERGRAVVPEGFGNLGWEGFTYPPAVQVLKQEGFLPGDFPENSAPALGFSHLFTEKPSRIRYHLEGANPPGRVALVYVHHEKRWAKDLSWVKVFYADVKRPERLRKVALVSDVNIR